MKREPNELTLRKDPIGGNLLGSTLQRPAGLLGDATHLILLIHGYNVTLCEAGCGYGAFRRSWSPDLLARSTALYWPGDAAPPFSRRDAHYSRGRIARTLSALTYSFQISTAQRAAELLAADIQARVARRRALQLDIVAHSLGCRLALELLQRLAAAQLGSRMTIRLAVLMAAAVPRYMIMQRGQLHAGAALAGRLLVFHSDADNILRDVFPFGQALEGGLMDRLHPGLRRAVGVAGVGAGLPKARSIARPGFDHGRYWRDERTAGQIAQHLDRERPLASLAREPATRRLSDKSRAARAPSGITVRTLQKRRLQALQQRPGLCGGCPDCD